MLSILAATLHVRHQQVHARNGVLHFVFRKALQRHCIHVQQGTAADVGDLAPARGKRHR